MGRKRRLRWKEKLKNKRSRRGLLNDGWGRRKRKRRIMRGKEEN